ncbi:MAG: Minor capsid [Herbinix sp.]|jgi:hypothetical protein|nr:Minor capsid [Herbinix sp.]
MEFNAKLEINNVGQLLKDRGLQDYGKVQKFIDSETMRLMAPYTPYLGGVLEKSAVLGTDIGSGEIHQGTPYARYQYYGKLMVSSLTGSAWSLGESKVLTDKDLEHNKSQHPMAGPFWFERMKADKKEQILRGAREVAGI